MMRCSLLVPLLLLIGQVPFRAPQDRGAHVQKESPHFNTRRCGDCHGRDLPEEAAVYGGLKNYYNRLCIQCHSRTAVVCRFHSKRTPTAGGKEGVAGFPLNAGQMYCLTCHEGRIQCVMASDPAAQENPLFLRGNPKGGPSRFCFACHSVGEFRPYNVHLYVKGSNQPINPDCYYCHETSLPAGRDDGSFPLKTDPGSTCIVCHRVKAHPGGIEHRVSMDKLEAFLEGGIEREKGRSGLRIEEKDSTVLLPLALEGGVQCDTCHDPHAVPAGGRFMLRTAAREALCRGCHGEGFEREH